MAMTLESFRTPGIRDTMFTTEHLHATRYQGDQHLETFYNQWMEILTGMMPRDVPDEEILRDILYKKIKDSGILAFEIRAYDVDGWTPYENVSILD